MFDESHVSLKANMLLNATRGILGILFPLITFPYVSRILGVNGIGRYNYSNSIISYFILLSELGISRYAIREGASYREDKNKIDQFSSEVFSINIFSTLFSYLLFATMFLFLPEIRKYGTLLGILSFQIILKTIGVEWIYSIFEDYFYITVRTIAFQILSLVLLFCLVHTKEDINAYAAITVISGAGSNILNFLHSMKRVRIRFTWKIDWKRHMRPIIVMFAMSLAISIYVNSDITVLGVLCGERTVGIYSVSSKIYSVVKSILSSVIVVSIPRLSAQFGTGRLSEFRATANDVYGMLITATLPAVTGIIILRDPIVLLVSGAEYGEASSSLCILAIALLMCMAAYFWGQCVLVPMNREDELFRVTVVSAVLNLALNFLLIPRWRENAAAFTTLLSEGCTFVWCMIQGKRFSGISGGARFYVKSAIGCLGILAVDFLTRRIFTGVIPYVIATVALSIVAYVLIEAALGNEAVTGIIYGIKNRLGI